MEMSNTLNTATLREIAAAGAVSSVRLVAQSDGFAIYIRYGLAEKVLQAKRGHVRRFKSLDRAAAYVRELGIAQMEVDVSNWHQQQGSLGTD